MNTEETININDLLSRPVWQLTCEEYCALMRHLLNESGSSATNNAASRQAIGMTALAKAPSSRELAGSRSSTSKSLANLPMTIWYVYAKNATAVHKH